MLFLKSKSSHIAAVEINIYEVERQQEGICPFYTILIVAMGLGTYSLPGMRVGKQAECLAGITLYRALCLLCLSSYPAWSCSAFSTWHRKVRLFGCMGNNSLTHWCQKYKLITAGKNVLHHGSFLSKIELFMIWSSLHPLSPLLMLDKAVAARVLLEDEVVSPLSRLSSLAADSWCDLTFMVP